MTDRPQASASLLMKRSQGVQGFERGQTAGPAAQPSRAGCAWLKLFERPRTGKHTGQLQPTGSSRTGDAAGCLQPNSRSFCRVPTGARFKLRAGLRFMAYGSGSSLQVARRLGKLSYENMHHSQRAAHVLAVLARCSTNAIRCISMKPCNLP